MSAEMSSQRPGVTKGRENATGLGSKNSKNNVTFEFLFVRDKQFAIFLKLSGHLWDLRDMSRCLFPKEMPKDKKQRQM